MFVLFVVRDFRYGIELLAKRKARLVFWQPVSQKPPENLQIIIMPFTAYLPSGFQHRHENELFEELVQSLATRFSGSPERHVLIGNVMFEGHEMDGVFLKPDGICIVEMKSHGGQVHFTENTQWFAGQHEVRGGNHANPFQQVRTYRFALRNYLRVRELQILRQPHLVEWNHIAGMVLFGREIQFDDTVLGALRSWFHVTDLPRVAERLATIRSNQLGLASEEIGALLSLLGLSDRHIYATGAGVQGAPLQASPQPAVGRLRLTYLKEFPFRDHELRLRNLGGPCSQAAQTVRGLFEQMRQGLDPLANMARREDARINGALVFPLNAACELVLIKNCTMLFPAFVGEVSDVEGWLDAHKGLVVAVDGDSHRITVTRVTVAAPPPEMQPATLTAEPQPLLARLPELHLEELVPQKLIRKHLAELDETSSDDEILDSLEAVADEDVRNFLFDLINLIRAGDIAAAEARLNLRTGKAVPTADAGSLAVEAALSDTNSDQVIVINDLSKEQLDRLLDPVNFHEWMLFLHPDQKVLADGKYDRPVVLKGVSGSGKTCILVHRARTLAQRYPGQRIGILTLSKTLAGLLQNLVTRLCSEEERKSIKVLAFYEVFRDCLRHLGPEKYFNQLAEQLPDTAHMHRVLRNARERWPDGMIWDVDPINHACVEDEWDEFYMAQHPDAKDWMQELEKYLVENNIDASRYIEEEFTLIRSAFTVPTRNDYLGFRRLGRSVQFREELRKDALRLLLFWEEWLLAGGFIDALGLTQALMPLHSEMQRLPESLGFRCLLVDEFQDFSTLDLQLLRRIVPRDQPDALFLAGDTVQRILVKRLTLSDAGFDTGAAAHHRIKKNYRNSRQILRAASRLANHYGSMAGAQGEEIEVLDPELAQRETNPPIILKTDDQVVKAWEIALECTADQKAEPWTVCIVTAAPKKVTVQQILSARPDVLAAEPLSGDCILHPDKVVVGTISDLKGFEFRLVLILGCDAGFFPPQGTPRDEVWRDALRLYVAMTRGRDQVFLLHDKEPSSFIEIMGDTVISREEPVFRRYVVAPIPTESTRSAVRAPAPINTNVPALDLDKNCENWFADDELDALKRYFARHVYRDGLTFHEWCIPRGLATIGRTRFRSLPKCPTTLIEQVISKLSAKGVSIAR